MGYYMGDYYRGGRGDYYRGDPFSIGGLLGGIGRAVVGGVRGLVTGGPIGAIGGAIGGLAGRNGEGAAMPGGGIVPIRPMVPVPAGLPPLPGLIPVKKPGLRGAVERLLPGGSTGYVYGQRRRMNVTNAKALRRAIRRVSGFGKLVQRSKRAIARANTAVGNKSRSSSKRRFGK